MVEQETGRREPKFKNKNVQELLAMNQTDLLQLLPSRIRRTIKRGLSENHKKLLKKIATAKEGKRKKPIKTHLRDMPILPEMIGVTIQVYTGKAFEEVELKTEMIGHYLGEFALTRREIKHSAPGVGATKGSAHTSVK